MVISPGLSTDVDKVRCIDAVDVLAVDNYRSYEISTGLGYGCLWILWITLKAGDPRYDQANKFDPDGISRVP